MINSLAVIYVYNQFSSLRKAGSKYLLSELVEDLCVVIHVLCTLSSSSVSPLSRSLSLSPTLSPPPAPHLSNPCPPLLFISPTLGIAGLFTIFASFVFGSGVVNLLDKRASVVR